MLVSSAISMIRVCFLISLCALEQYYYDNSYYWRMLWLPGAVQQLHNRANIPVRLLINDEVPTW